MNLSDSHTFHKMETSEIGDSSINEMKESEELVERSSNKGQKDEVGNDLADQDSRRVDTPLSQFFKS